MINDRSLDFTALAPGLQGKWVVLSKETHQFYSADRSPKTALEKAKQEGCLDPILYKAMPVDKGFVSQS